MFDEDAIFDEFEKTIKESSMVFRITSIEFHNFRNIEAGKLLFPNANTKEINSDSSSILGIYGQNGSGKSSVIMALQILKLLLSGKAIDDSFESCIRSGSNRATLTFRFAVIGKTDSWNDYAELSPMLKEETYDIFYSFDIVRNLPSFEQEIHLSIENERLSVAFTNSDKSISIPKTTFIDTSKGDSEKPKLPFGSKPKYQLIVGNNKDILDLLNEQKKIAERESRSFIFSADVISVFLNETYYENKLKLQKLLKDYFDICHDAKDSNDFERIIPVVTQLLNTSYDISHIEKTVTEESLLKLYKANPNDFFTSIGTSLNKLDLRKKNLYLSTLSLLYEWGLNYLHIVDTSSTGRINLNQSFPIVNISSLEGTDFIYETTIHYINTIGCTELSESGFKDVSLTVEALNLVLTSIIPGLSVVIKKENTTVDSNDAIIKFELMASRESAIIPLKYESDGVRRIISMLSLMIAAYNNPSVTLAVDEIDSGIFEYLLGNLLSVFCESGKGQMIFTSHNLRPLEVLPAKSICFTTTNPDHRFTTVSKRGNSNLRDTYIRALRQGTDDIALCSETSKYDIENAFSLAGSVVEE